MSYGHKSKKSFLSFDILGTVTYILVFSLLLFYSNKLGEPDADSGKIGIVFQGVSMQLRLLLSAFIVVAVSEKGYPVAVIVNIFSALNYIISLCASNSASAVNSLISTIATIILITIIHVFYQKIVKNNRELTKANQILQEKDEKLSFLVHYDILTGLPNRQLFIERIDEAINLEASVPFTVIAANIDNFKLINNEFGNNAGDAVLCSYSKKLKRFCGNSMFLARINGDEFGIIVYGKESEITILNYIEAIREIVAEPIRFQEIKINVTMSFGIASYPANASNSTDILKCVNSALGFSKMNGKNTHFFYSNVPVSPNYM